MFASSQIESLRERLQGARRSAQRIALVPTMGNLHAGHLSLVARARELADVVVVSIFVNPLQFDRAEDLANYPRTLEQDLERLATSGVDLIFHPAPDAVYPRGMEMSTRVEVPIISEHLEGAMRPGHFTGVATIVAKLFNMIQPDLAVFGEKDYQQLLVIRQLVADLNWPIDIVAAPTMREADGLAMSSRNQLLSPADRRKAAGLYRVLQSLKAALLAGRIPVRELEVRGLEALEAEGFRPEYLEICQADTLLPAEAGDRAIVMVAAAWIGEVRLIDNLQIQREG